MANYPDWVKQFRQKGTAVKKVGNSYYLYRHSSKRVQGKRPAFGGVKRQGRSLPFLRCFPMWKIRGITVEKSMIFVKSLP